jgi:hypothetical protein
MGIQINGQTDTITAIDGALTVSGADLPTVTNLNATGIVTATGFVGNITGNINATGVSTIATLNVTQSNPTNLNVSGVATVSAGSASAPSITPTGDSNTGIFFPSADTVCIGEGGTEVVRIHNLGRVLVGTANTDIAGAPSNKGAKQFIYTADGNGEWALQARNDSSTGNGFFLRAGNSSTTYTARFTGYDENNVHLNVDGLGRVTTPLQPAFIATKNSGQTLTQSVNNVVTFDTEVIDIGSNYSSNKFTAPVSGTYQFQFTCMGSSSNSGYVRIALKKNGSGFYGTTYATITVSAYESIVTSSLINLSANDYVEAEIYPTMASFALDNTGTFSGYLVG